MFIPYDINTMLETKLFNGKKIIYLYDRFVGMQIHVNKVWEPITTMFLMGVLLNRKMDTFLDIGSHIGYYSVVLSGFFENLIAIEPNKDIFKLLKANALMYENIIPINIAIGDKKKEIILYTDLYNSAATSYDKNEELFTPIKGQQDRLDNLGINFDKVDIVKIDAEKQDEHILREFFHLFKIGTIFVVESPVINSSMNQFLFNKVDMLAAIEGNYIFIKI